MRWAWKLGRLFGIQIQVHATFALLLLWVGFAHWFAERSLWAVGAGIAFVLAIFACVVLHELGHALAARQYGITTRDITLLPIGGVARLERMPDDPRHEIWVALAGPAVNVVIAAALFGGLVLGGSPPASLVDSSGAAGVERLLWVNVFLVVFNLLPAFPMGGGRILRGLLATAMNYVRATRIAAGLGQILAFFLGLVGLLYFYNPLLVLIAVFVWTGAAQETQVAEVRSVIDGVRVESAMLTDYIAVTPSDSLGRVAELMVAGSQEDFPVVEDQRVVGIVTRDDLIPALSRAGEAAAVAQIMQRDFKTVEASEMLEAVVPRLQTAPCRVIPVTRSGELVGLITPENVGEFVMIKAALEEERRAAA